MHIFRAVPSNTMKLLLPFLFAALLAVTCGATIEPVQTSEPTEAGEEADEYRWRQEVGKALEKVGKWLQGKYTAQTEEEEEMMGLMIAQIDQMAADVNEKLSDLYGELDEDEDGVASYGLIEKLRRWRKKLAEVTRKIFGAVVIGKVAGAIG